MCFVLIRYDFNYFISLSMNNTRESQVSVHYHHLVNLISLHLIKVKEDILFFFHYCILDKSRAYNKKDIQNR